MNQRILIIGKRGGILQWYEHLLAAQNQLPNHKIEGFALNHNHFFERANKTVSGLLNKKNKDKITAKALDKKLTAFHPTLVLIADLFYLSNEVISVLHKHKQTMKVVHWIGDFFDERLIRAREITDRYYFTDSGLLEDANAIGLTNSSYLPLAFNPDLFKPPEQEQRINDLLFIGAWSKNREELVRQVTLPMTVAGKGWDKIADTHHKVIGKNVSNKQVAKLYQQHACVLNIINSGNIKNGLNMRCFEAPACGAVLITDNVIDLANCYVDGTEVLTYENPESLASVYRMILDDDTKQKRIARAGSLKASDKHSYACRIEAIAKDTYGT
ncbi:CgeB family protein [Alkalimarinus coralli]|uniref:CgeB family protein n=1 Tax=Alkalimarinus coralli TaxID=2935863 RepID=UPI00202B7D22|nr:glycosyltransferase [Alkalimarinus coralli]